MLFVTRAEWGARPARGLSDGNLNRASTLHWNGPNVTVGGKLMWEHKYCAGLVRGIQNYHMDGNGWNDIGYNFVGCPHGYIFEGRGLNKINAANGTNVGNRTSHGIMNLAGPNNPFSNDEKIGVKECVAYISRSAGAPNACRGHRDHKSTSCPGDERYSWVHAGMPTSAPAPTPKPTPPTDNEEDMRLYHPHDTPGDSGAIWLRMGDNVGKVANPTEMKSLQKLQGVTTERVDAPAWKAIKRVAKLDSVSVNVDAASAKAVVEEFGKLFK